LDIFCIAFHENQLNVAKKKELHQFISVHPQLEETLYLYGKVKLIPNTSLIYENKLALKQSRIKPLFPIISVAASALIVFFGYQVWKNPNYGESGAVLKRTELGFKRAPKPRILGADKNANELFRDTIGSNFNHIPQNLIENHENDRFITQLKTVNNKLDIDNLKKRIPSLERLSQSLEIKNIPEQIIVPRMVEQENYHVAAIEMKNPIKPVTKRLSEITKTQIDYRTAKAVDKTKKGFFIKIGKFEVSRM
jgi:hypothetical protein